MELDRPNEHGLGGYVVRTQDSHSLTAIGGCRAKNTLLALQGSLLERSNFGNSALNPYFKGNRDFAPGPLAARGAFRIKALVKSNRVRLVTHLFLHLNAADDAVLPSWPAFIKIHDLLAD